MKKTVMKATMKKGMKTKRVSIIARGRMAKSLVFSGKKEKTVGGLTKKDFVKNKYGKLVSRKRAQASKNNAWSNALRQARKALGRMAKSLVFSGRKEKTV